MPSASPIPIHEVEWILSAGRFSTYLRAAQGDTTRALELYAWNAQVSAALMVPSHFAEVAVRNAVDEVLTVVYGSRWPWSTTLEQALPTPARGFNPRRELCQTRIGHTTPGKVVADLKFAFWENMFTSRHDERLWRPHLMRVFPHAETTDVSALRRAIYHDLDEVRRLRNRIAHHEPLLDEDLSTKLAVIERTASRRSTAWLKWLQTWSSAAKVIANRP